MAREGRQKKGNTVYCTLYRMKRVVAVTHMKTECLKSPYKLTNLNSANYELGILTF